MHSFLILYKQRILHQTNGFLHGSFVIGRVPSAESPNDRVRLAGNQGMTYHPYSGT